ncbi:MAG: MjaI family restriction endonuclease [Flavobacteriales bacterium]|nr:MjaI family restriction endonuclease [Flavobacteriales bacterium]
MKKLKIKNDEIHELVVGETIAFPKYTTQLMNLANSNAQGTRPKVVGQMSELIQEFTGNDIKSWEVWYKERNPDAIQNATDRIYDMVKNFQKSILLIDRGMIERWVEDLVVNKTFVGLRFQEAILKKIAEAKGENYRLANPSEESQGIDGYIGYVPVSIKPLSYQSKGNLVEEIAVQMVFYEKKKDGLVIYYDF